MSDVQTDRAAAMRAARERRTVRLLEVSTLAPAVKRFVFALESGSVMPFSAGQYLNLYLPSGDETLQRSYSLSASSTAMEGRFEFAVTHVDGGAGSTALHAMKVGTVIEADGPWGLFTLGRAPADAPKLFVATGTGLTPIRAMIQDELARGDDGPPVHLLFGCRTPADILWRDEYEALAADHPRFSYSTTLSRAEESWAGRRGYVQTHLGELLGELAGGDTTHVFVCGLKRMIDEVRAQLKDTHGFDRKRIHTERFD